MTTTSTLSERLFEKFDRHPTFNSLLVVALFLLINNTLLATSKWMETTRDGSPGFNMWEPFVWEYTSALSTLLFLIPVFWFWRRYPLRFAHTGRQLLLHFLVSLAYSVCHVAMMVMLREGIYFFTDSTYQFSPWLREFFYEYRKDVWGYATFLVAFHLYEKAYGRLKGEANLIEDEQPAQNAEAQNAHAPEHLLVKKLDRDFLVKVDDISWLESNGNYVNMHASGRIYPLRSTLAQLTERLTAKGFVRVHRSFAVNQHCISSISTNNSGDGEIQLSDGKSIPLSRRYKDQLKQELAS